MYNRIISEKLYLTNMQKDMSEKRFCVRQNTNIGTSRKFFVLLRTD